MNKKKGRNKKPRQNFESQTESADIASNRATCAPKGCAAARSEPKVENPAVPITPGSLAAELVLQMEALTQTLAIAGTATQIIQKRTQSEFADFAEKVGGTRKTLPDGTVSFSIPVSQRRAADRIFRAVDIFQRGKQALASNFLVALVAEFDVFLAQLLRWLWSKNPATFGLAQKTVRMEELQGLAQVTDVEAMLLEREVDEQLRASRSDQFAWLEKHLKVQLGTQSDQWMEFIEAHERRNLCVHTGCRVSRQYIAACHRLGVSDIPMLGAVLDITPEYISKVSSIFSEIAVMTAQVIWRKIEGDPHEAADILLVDTTYKLLEDAKYGLAATLLCFGLTHVRKPSSERIRKTWRINYSQALKRSGRLDEALLALREEDWSAASGDFKMAVAILEDDFAAAASFMKQLGKDGALTEVDYRDWPLFEEFRRTEEFLSAYREVFGGDYSGFEIGMLKIEFAVDGSNRQIVERESGSSVAERSAVIE